jgi:hypothetical protein
MLCAQFTLCKLSVVISREVEDVNYIGRKLEGYGKNGDLK